MPVGTKIYQSYGAGVMKITVAVCDDENKEAEYIKSLVALWARQNGYNALIRDFPSAEAFLFCYEEFKSFDVLLLDIQMKGIDGIELAKKIRETDSTVQIAFITGFDEYMSEGYEVSALHYLMKPVNEEKLFAVLDRAVAAMGKAEPAVVLNIDGESVKVKLSDIVSAEASAHNVTFRTLTGTLTLGKSIAQAGEMLGNGFFRCHRSYLVNLHHVSRIGRSDVFLDDGSSVPLSRRQYEEINKAFISYYRK